MKYFLGMESILEIPPGNCFAFAKSRPDLPDADLNLSFRLQQMTSLRVDPDGRLIRLNDPELFQYPFLFVSAPGALHLTEPETEALRDYLNNGGFVLMDDFWGEEEWENCESVTRRTRFVAVSVAAESVSASGPAGA